MTDRENVISTLEDIKTQTAEIGLDSAVIAHKFIDEILTLLKEQEAVEPTFKQGEDGIFVWACGSCGAYMYHIYDGIDKAKEYAKYCRQCGKKVKWE